MSSFALGFLRAWLRLVIGSLVAAVVLLQSSLAQAQAYSGVSQAVGGISIDPNGVMNKATLDKTGWLHDYRAKGLEALPHELGQWTPQRKVSLRGLEKAIARQLDNGQPLSDAVRHLAGLQRIDLVLVYPEQKDIVLVGPAEGWKVDAQGNVIGASSGRPVMQLDDLLVALRAARQAAQGISCSIDPTAEGLTRLRGAVAKLHTIGPNPQGTATYIQEMLGPQTISVSGVPATSHFARVLVAADYRMKRLAMHFDPPPIRGLPSYLEMVSTAHAGMNNMLPRWWLTAQYDALTRDDEGLAWQLPGASVLAMTEEDHLAADGAREHTGKAGGPAKKWADTMTAKYDELSLADPIFGDLRNCMDLALVAALVAKENLVAKSGASLPLLLGTDGVKADIYPAPRKVDSQASLIQRGKNWVISASGGVQFNAWAALQQTKPAATLPPTTRPKAAQPKPDAWWWN
jgi:hypothetical protein